MIEAERMDDELENTTGCRFGTPDQCTPESHPDCGEDVFGFVAHLIASGEIQPETDCAYCYTDGLELIPAPNGDVACRNCVSVMKMLEF